ncbi:hypothetical protein ASG01_04210 [Chryseobacterium sp. Leaf180]|jgi:hypothetical protein|uniref:hypothetical protein n=1 Tax=Chryseobacterium sp. Leaf180 TaxID=1736289 RepID=UPI0006FE0092|nr:hypothetical protein [Chryseobacterium sp. Leaf180]KQR95067.1 hypothetical protein ASG01_04210 [Chryseobacterium sp. Leaf180]
MKKVLFVVFGLLSSATFAQTQDLSALASGQFAGMNAIFDTKENLYGYVSMYSYGKTSKTSQKFGYVILDKNLNPVANNEFESDISVGSYVGFMNFRNQIILKPVNINYMLVLSKTLTASPPSMVINIKDNTVKPKVYYDYKNGTFSEITEQKNWKEQRNDSRQEKKDLGYDYVAYVSEIKEGGYLATEHHDYGRYVNNNSIIRFDDNKKELWRYKYNTNGTKKVFSDISVLDRDENYMYSILRKSDGKDRAFSLLVIDMKTGKEVSNKPLSGLSPETLYNIDVFNSGNERIDNDKIFSDKIVYTGRNFVDSRTEGFARLMVDKKDFSTDLKTIAFRPDYQKYIKNIGKEGDVESGYYLQTKDMYFMNDGSVGILAEKYKPEGQYNAPKTTDLVYTYTDKDFKIKEIKILEKEKTRWANNDYLFSQYLNDGKDVVFFYRDYQKDQVTKEKKWNLFINTVIDGKFAQEIVPISEKDNFTVYPYVGKEGYILLHEFNTKEKYNKVRLERLNY